MKKVRATAITQDTLTHEYSQAGIYKTSWIPADSKSKIEAFLREFPFADPRPRLGFWGNGEAISGTSQILTVHVSRLTEKVIERKVLRGYHKEHIWLFDREGQIIEHQRYRMETFNFLWLWPVQLRVGYYSTSKLVHYQDSIMDVLEGLDEDASRVQYAVSYYEWTRALIIYKVIPDLDLVGYKTRLVQRQMTEEQAESEAFQQTFRELITD